jgi:hypothetical protein
MPSYLERPTNGQVRPPVDMDLLDSVSQPITRAEIDAVYEADEKALAARTASTPDRTGRLRPRGPLPVNWVRVPLPLFMKRRRGRWLLPAETRLLCLLIHKTGEGQRPFVLTDKAVAEIGLAPRTRRNILIRLERKSLVRVERVGARHAPAVSLIWVFG